MDDNFAAEILGFVFVLTVLIVLYFIGEGMGWLDPQMSLGDWMAEILTYL